MSNKTIPWLVGAVLLGGALLAGPFIIRGERTGSETQQPGEYGVIIYAADQPDGLVFGELVPALLELTKSYPVASVVVRTPVYRGEVIIARDHEHWRTIPPGVVFSLVDGRAEVFLDQTEFSLYLKKQPELARANTHALKLDDFFRMLLNAE